jgi:hypothetical protein
MGTDSRFEAACKPANISLAPDIADGQLATLRDVAPINGHGKGARSLTLNRPTATEPSSSGLARTERCVHSIVEGCFLILSAPLHVPGKWGVRGATSGGLLIRKVLPHTSGVHRVCEKDEDGGVFN